MNSLILKHLRIQTMNKVCVLSLFRYRIDIFVTNLLIYYLHLGIKCS